MKLPPFLQPWANQTDSTTDTAWTRATFKHTGVLENNLAEVLYWPSLLKSTPTPTLRSSPGTPNNHTVLLFVPGNPGLVDFYIPFLSALQERYQALVPEGKASQISIVAKAHLGHSPTLFASGCNKSGQTRTDLISQVESVVQIYDTIRQHHTNPEPKSQTPQATRVILVGHSVGAWISLQVLGVVKVLTRGLICPFRS